MNTVEQLERASLAIVQSDNETLKKLLKKTESLVNALLPPSKMISAQELKKYAHTNPLFVALKEENLEAVQLLLANGAKVDTCIYALDGSLITPYQMSYFAKNPHIKAVMREHAQTQDKMVTVRKNVQSAGMKSLKFGKGKK